MGAFKHILKVLFKKMFKPKCEHKNTNWYIKRYEGQKVQLFNLSGETRYLYCDDCGEELRNAFFPNFDGS